MLSRQRIVASYVVQEDHHIRTITAYNLRLQVAHVGAHNVSGHVDLQTECTHHQILLALTLNLSNEEKQLVLAQV